MQLNRRDFLRMSAMTGVTFSTGSLLSAHASAASPVAPRRVGANGKLNVLCIGVVGSIGGVDRIRRCTSPACATWMPITWRKPATSTRTPSA
jgi:hypothetical protein